MAVVVTCAACGKDYEVDGKLLAVGVVWWLDCPDCCPTLPDPADPDADAAPAETAG